VIERLPVASALVMSCADPDETGLVPSDVAPSKNSTEPVAPDGVTVAVNVTDWPNVDGFGALASAVLELAGFTVWLCAGDVLPVKLASPEYTAVSEWTPAFRLLVLSTALPDETGLVPSDVAPSKNSTEPPGPPAPGETTETVAVSAMLAPNVDGFGALLSAVDVLAWFTV
jgi:hypothetical protein